MTPGEFKAWFDGFTEAFSGCPTKAQWARIKDRVAEIDGNPVTELVYVDRYWPTYVGSYPGRVGSPTFYGAIGGLCTTSNTISQNCSSQIGSGGSAFNSTSAMADLGRAEAKSLAS